MCTGRHIPREIRSSKHAASLSRYAFTAVTHCLMCTLVSSRLDHIPKDGLSMTLAPSPHVQDLAGPACRRADTSPAQSPLASNPWAATTKAFQALKEL